MAIRFKQTKKFNKPSLEKLLNSYAEETGFIDEDKVKELLKSENKDKLIEHLVEWDKLVDNAQDNEALKKADEIRQMIRGHKKFSRLRRFSDDKMLFVEYVDEDGDTTHQVMKKSEFEQVKDEAKINRASGAKLKILTEEVYDETNPKHKKYKDHPVTETKEFTDHDSERSFAETREQVPQYIADEVDKNGVIVKYKESWRIVSKKQKPYEFWDATYDTKEDAEAALAAYHANKR